MKNIPVEYPLPVDCNGDPLTFNSFVRGTDTAGNPVAGVVRGFGPPAGFYDGNDSYGTQGPIDTFVLVHIRDDIYAECFASRLMHRFSMGPSPYEVGLHRDDQTGRVRPVADPLSPRAPEKIET